jgi:glycosyltransferase involved in cell wall biosynthesis
MPAKRIVIVATHPIQYHIPWYRTLAASKNCELTVIYGMQLDSKQQSIGFDKEFSWDIPLMEGYQWQLLDNTAKTPGVEKFNGIDCPSIKQVLQGLKPDLVIITGWQSRILLQALFAARKLKIKIVMRGESNAMYKRAFYKRLLHRMLLTRVDAFLAIGSANREFYLNNGVDDAVIFRAPYFVDNDRFHKISGLSSQEKSDLRTQFSIPDSSYCFIYSGKLIDKKNVQELLNSFLILYEKHSDIHLLIIGDGKQKPALTSFVHDHQLPITFAGFVNQSEIPKLYSIGDCFLLASNYGETWGLVVNEAMICGLPAIVSDRVGCGPDIIIPGETGYVYPFGDTAELAKYMRSMTENRETSKKMGAQAQKHVLESFNVEHTVSATLKALDYLSANNSQS